MAACPWGLKERGGRRYRRSGCRGGDSGGLPPPVGPGPLSRPGKATVALIYMHCKRFYAQMGASRKIQENRQKLVFRLLRLCNGCYSYAKWVLLFCINLTKSACIKMGATHIYECYPCIKGPLYGVIHRYTPFIRKMRISMQKSGQNCICDDLCSGCIKKVRKQEKKEK